MNKKIIPTDIAYIAGYIDGDGCFFLGTERRKGRIKPKYVVSIVISSVNKHVLDYFKKTFGGSVNLVNKEQGNSKALYQYSIKKRDTIFLAKQILPYLVEKREECLLTIQFAESDSLEDKESFINKIRILKDTGNLVSKYHKKEFEKQKNTIIPTEIDFSYLAGFIDAECCFGIQKYLNKAKPNYLYKIELQCNNTKYPVFQWLSQRFGGHIGFIDRLNTLKARKNQLKWRLSSKALFQILGKIHPFLKHKKAVCEELMKFYSTTLPNGGARHTDEFRTHYAMIIRKREEIVATVHKLNLKGIKSI